MSLWRGLLALSVLLLAACGSAPPLPVPVQTPAALPTELPPSYQEGASLLRDKSRWVAVPWSALPGFDDDALVEAWNAWLKSCERPGRVFAPLCPDVRRLSIADEADKRAWMVAQLQPYQVQAVQGGSPEGLLTAYFEPEFEARRLPGQGFEVPLYQPPVGLNARQPWFTRQEIDTLPAAQAALR